MKSSLGLILALCLAGLQFVAVTTVVLSSYLTSERALLEHARSLLSDIGTNTIEHSKGFLKPALGAAELATRLAENEVIASDDLALLEKLLFQQLQIAPQFAGVFYGDEQGNFVYVMRSKGPGPFRSKLITHTDGTRATELIWRNNDYLALKSEPEPGDTYDPRARPWYQDAKTELNTIWTDPYIFFTAKTPGITVASPVFDADRNLQGVIGVDIEINAISSFLAGLEVGDSGVALILNRNGDVIAHPDQELIKRVNDDGTMRFSSIDEINDPIARQAFGSIARDGEVSVASETSLGFQYMGAGYVSTVMPIISEDLPWTIAVYAPESDFTSAIRENRTNNIWIAAIIALGSGLIGLVLANYIHKPVRAFAVRSTLISQGELPADTPLPKTYKDLERVNDALLREIAERKKSEKEYGRTFELSSRGMAAIDPATGQIIRANAKLAEMIGYDLDVMTQMKITDFSHPDDKDIGMSFDGSAINDAPLLYEKRCIRKDGEEIWVSVNAILIRDDKGAPLHAVVTVDDLTQSKIADMEIQQLNRDLTHTARVNMMGQMATSLAHELNQPLTAITQNMDTALNTISKTDKDAQLRAVLEETDQQAHRAGDIIRALRDFVRKDEIERKVFDFRELLEQTLRLVRSEAKVHGTTLRIETSDLRPVIGSRVQVAQVIVNLLRNSIEAIAQSDVNYRVVTISAENTSRGVSVAVEDTGPGFPEGFDPFAKFETTKKDGMGIGLSICQTIVEAHGGKLWYDAQSKHPRFCFNLPSVNG